MFNKTQQTTFKIPFLFKLTPKISIRCFVDKQKNFTLKIFLKQLILINTAAKKQQIPFQERNSLLYIRSRFSSILLLFLLFMMLEYRLLRKLCRYQNTYTCLREKLQLVLKLPESFDFSKMM